MFPQDAAGLTGPGLGRIGSWLNRRHLAILLLTAVAWVAQAEDWPQWRGPRRDGVWRDTGLGRTFPTNGLPVRWRAPVSYGFSSPVIAKGRVYVTDAQLD